METARERFFITNTMILLLKTVEGKITTVELHDEKEATGLVKYVDGYMNITMENVVFKTSTRSPKLFDKFFVNGKTVRYVHIPDEIDMRSDMEKKLKQYNREAMNVEVKQKIMDEAWKKMKRREAWQKKHGHLKGADKRSELFHREDRKPELFHREERKPELFHREDRKPDCLKDSDIKREIV